MYQGTVQANAFKSAMTYEILDCGHQHGFVSGSVMASFLFIACSEWWMRFLDSELMIGLLKCRCCVPVSAWWYSILIMLVVLFHGRGIMGTGN